MFYRLPYVIESKKRFPYPTYCIVITVVYFFVCFSFLKLFIIHDQRRLIASKVQESTIFLLEDSKGSFRVIAQLHSNNDTLMTIKEIEYFMNNILLVNVCIQENPRTLLDTV